MNFSSLPTRTRTSQKTMTPSFLFAATPSCVASVTTMTAAKTAAYNIQLHGYLQTCQLQQELLLQRTQQHLNQVYSTTQNPTASLLRDRSTWSSVKKLVVREELMKAQITGDFDMPLFGSEKQEVLEMIQGKNLANMNDPEVESIIERFLKVDERAYLDALIEYKATGRASDLLQQAKLNELSSELQNIDLQRISRDQYKQLLENYCERPEFHHRESISSDPTKQSLADNIDVLDTTAHDLKHTDGDKINYQKPVSEEPLNRTGEMVEGNKRRVLRNELTGLGISMAIGLGVGFTFSVISEIAQHGICSDEIENMIFRSLSAGVESGFIAGVSHVVGRGVSAAMEEIFTSTAVEAVGLDIASGTGLLVNNAAVGLLSTAIICTYQYVKSRVSGANSAEAIQALKGTAVSSIALLSISIAAQGIWEGPAGIIVSTGVGVFYFAVNTAKSVHMRNLELRLREFSIEEYRAVAGNPKIIYI